MRFELKSTVTDHSIDLNQLAERVIIGPQEEVLTAIEDINDTFNANIRCTKKFRWEPGFYNKLNALQIKAMSLDKKPRTVKTAFNNVGNNDWLYRRLRDKIRAVDGMLYRLRSNNLAFQDNSETVFESTTQWLNSISSTAEVMNAADNGYTFEIYHALGDDLKDYILFVISIENLSMNIGDSDNFAPVKCGKVKMFTALDMLQILGSAISDTEARFDSRYMHHGYHIGGQYTPLEEKLLFPYISNRGRTSYSRSIRYSNIDEYVRDDILGLEVSSESTDGFGNLCLGDLKDQVLGTLAKGRLDETVFWLNKWGGFYNINRTGPLNNYSKMYWGQPKALYSDNMDGVLGSRNTSDCYYEPVENKLESYCEVNECLLRDNCSKYENAYVEVTEDIVAIREQMIANYLTAIGGISNDILSYNEALSSTMTSLEESWTTAVSYYDRMYAGILLHFNIEIDRDNMIYLMASSCSTENFQQTIDDMHAYDDTVEGYHAWLDHNYPNRTITPEGTIHVAPSESGTRTETQLEIMERNLLEHYTSSGRGIPIQIRERV